MLGSGFALCDLGLEVSTFVPAFPELPPAHEMRSVQFSEKSGLLQIKANKLGWFDPKPWKRLTGFGVSRVTDSKCHYSDPNGKTFILSNVGLE